MKICYAIVLLCFVVTSFAKEQQKRGIFDSFLNNFDFQCLKDMVQDQDALDALQKLGEMDLSSTEADESSMINLGALELSEHIECTQFMSNECDTNVDVLPDASVIAEKIAIISQEIQQKSDDEILQALNYDIDRLCENVQGLEDALNPYIPCINKNLNAMAALPTNIKNAIMNLINQNSNSDGTNPWDFDLTEALKLSNGCADFKHQVAESLRSQLTQEFWTDVFTDILSNYNGAAFEVRVRDDLDSTFSCPVDKQLICTKQSSEFFAICKLVASKDLNFELLEPLDGNFDQGSIYYQAFETYANTHSNSYPCDSTFKDNCFKSYLEEIPNLGLNTNCRHLGLPPPPPPGPSTPNNPNPNPNPNPSTPNNPNPNPDPNPNPNPNPNPSTPNNPNPNPQDPNSDQNGSTGDQTDTGSSSGNMDGSGNISAGGLSGGEVAAIVIVCVGVVLGLVVSVFIVYKRRQADPERFIQL